MGSCILTFSLHSTFKLLLFVLCFSYTNIVTTTSQSVVPGFLEGAGCAVMNCGEGTCIGSNVTTLGFDCVCKPGWKQIPVVSKIYPACVLPNCTVNFQCGSGAPPTPPPFLTNDTSSPCNFVYCGNGNCVVNETSHYCQCDQGFANLFGSSSNACFEQCFFGADCKNLGLGEAAPPSTSSGSPKTGTEEDQDGPIIIANLRENDKRLYKSTTKDLIQLRTSNNLTKITSGTEQMEHLTS